MKIMNPIKFNNNDKLPKSALRPYKSNKIMTIERKGIMPHLEILTKYAAKHAVSFSDVESNAIVEAMEDHALEMLQGYTDFLVKHGYCDTDVYYESPPAIDRYLNPQLREELI